MDRMRIATAMLIMSAIALTGCGTGATADQVAQGKRLVPKICVRCHPLAIVTGHRDDAAGWRKVTTRMKGYGAQFSADEEAAIVAYLAKTQPK